MSAGAALVAAVVAGTVLVGTAPWGAPGRLRSAGARHGGGRAGPGRGAAGGVHRARVAGRRPRGAGGGRSTPAQVPVDPAFLLDLCAASLAAGSALPRTLTVVGRHLAGADGAALVRAGATLELGGQWHLAWAGAPPGAAAVADALATAWEAGASPGPQLRAASHRLRRERRARVRTASGALAVRLTLPLGACFLPAFVLLGLVPVVLGLAGGLGW